MKRSEAIRRAVGQLPVSEPSADLTARIMVRLQRAERRRRRIEALLAGTCTAACVAGLAAVARWAFARGAEAAGTFTPPGESVWNRLRIDISLPAFPAEDAALWKVWALLAAAGLVLLAADLLIRRRIASLRK